MDKFEEILNSLPNNRTHSRLDPYASLIRELLRRGRTYREVGQILREKCGIQISFSTVHHFMHARSRLKPKSLKSRPQNCGKNTVNPTLNKEEQEGASVKRETPAIDEVYKRIAALKQRSALPQNSSKHFHYDPDEPLHLPSKSGKNKPEQ
jgi:hypothetical protein